MTQAIRFEAPNGGQSYVFPVAQGTQEIRDNFRDVRSNFVTFAAAHGAFDVYSGGQAPYGAGLITVQFSLWSNTRAGMTALRDAVADLPEFGRGVLVVQPSDGNAAERFNYCRCISVDLSEQPAQHTDLLQPVTCVFQTGEPYWLSNVSGGALWGGFTWGGGTDWGQGFTADTVSGLSTTIAKTNNGNAMTLPKIVIDVVSPNTVSSIRFERESGGVLVDCFEYNAAMSAGDTLIIDTRRQRVTINGVDSFNDNFDYLHPDLFRLIPGSNSIKVKLGSASDQANVTLFWLERYKNSG